MSEAKGIHAGRMLALALAGLLAAAGAPAASLKDPTRPPEARPAKAQKAARAPLRWRLGSTLVSPQRRAAVINGRVVGVGETINGARVVEILPAKVRLRRKGRDITLVLLKQDIKRPSRPGSGKP